MTAKIIPLFLVFTLFVGIGSLTACGKKEEEKEVIDYSLAIKPPVEEKIPVADLIYRFAKSVKHENAKEYYVEEVKRRVLSGEDFISKEEEEYFIERGFEVGDTLGGILFKSESSLYIYTSFYYPVWVKISDYSDSLILIYCDKSGKIMSGSNITGDYKGTIHCNLLNLSEDAKIISSDIGISLVYFPDQDLIRAYQWGECVDETWISGKYCGESYFEGHLFRIGSEVYSLTYDYNAKQFTTTLIATDVKEVIEANYSLASTAWSQPLFLMNDGSLKAYVKWEGGQLLSPYYEGGYKASN